MNRYKGKNAWWFILIFVVFNLLPFPLFFKGVEFNIVLGVIRLFYYLVVDMIFVPLLVRNYIDVYDDYFLFYYGWSKRKVMIDKIKKIEKSKSLMASSANSLDRIYIETVEEDFMVSLKENDKFMEEIKALKKN